MFCPICSLNDYKNDHPTFVDKLFVNRFSDCDKCPQFFRNRQLFVEFIKDK